MEIKANIKALFIRHAFTKTIDASRQASLLYMLNDVKLDNVQLVKHLGHIITSDFTDDKDIMHQASMYNRKANTVLSDFKHISGDLRVKIMQSYCSSLYGSQLSNLSNNCIDRLSISWRKSIRKALNVPARTHSVYLPLICECLPLNVQLELRVMKFFYERYKQYKQNVSCF